MHMYVYIYIYICTYVYICIYHMETWIKLRLRPVEQCDLDLCWLRISWGTIIPFIYWGLYRNSYNRGIPYEQLPDCYKVGPPFSIAMLVNIYPITMWLLVLITTVFMGL